MKRELYFVEEKDTLKSYLSRVAAFMRDSNNTMSKKAESEFKDYLFNIMKRYLTEQSRFMAMRQTNNDCVDDLVRISFDVFYKYLPQFNDPDKISDRKDGYAVDTFFSKFVRREAERKYRGENEDCYQYEIDRKSHVKYMKEFVAQMLMKDPESVSAEEIFEAQNVSGRKTNLTLEQIENTMRLMESTADINSVEEKHISHSEDGFNNILREETLRELRDYMETLYANNRFDLRVFLTGYTTKVSITYEKIGRDPDIVNLCKDGRYEDRIRKDGDTEYLEGQFINDRCRAVCRNILKYWKKQNLYGINLEECLQRLIDDMYDTD